VKLFNTLTRQKEEFIPQGDTVKMYVCGVTPYDECHLGHAMSYIIFDVLRRYLEFRGFRVSYVQNFTDIDDKIIARAQKMGISTTELTERFINQYFADMDALNINRVDIYPKASEEIPDMLKVIQGLVDKGYAYASKDGVYFRVNSDPDYGKLSHRSLADLIPSTEGGSEKEHQLDFALWKAAKEGEPCWGSPWGKGRPGWHIECSTMALKYLGESLDIHGGGQDLIFPHHENEIAQSECFSGVVPFAKYWLHNGLLHWGEEKLSKSSGNLITIKQALGRFSADAIRLFVLSSHYRSPLTFSEQALEAMERGVERLRQAAWGGGGNGVELVEVVPFQRRFIEAMEDDLNTPQAIAALFDLAREINRARDEGFMVDQAQQMLLGLANILGLRLGEEEAHLEAEPFIELLISVRNELRRNKQFQLADKIRTALGQLNIALEDASQGTRWKYRK